MAYVRVYSVLYLMRKKDRTLPEDAAPEYRRHIRFLGHESAPTEPISTTFRRVFDSEKFSRGLVERTRQFTIVIDGTEHAVSVSDIDSCLSFIVVNHVLDPSEYYWMRIEAEQQAWRVGQESWFDWNQDLIDTVGFPA